METVLAVVLTGLVLLFAALTLYVLFRLKKHERQHQALIRVLRNEIHAMTGSTIGMGKRLGDVEHRLSITVERQQALENRDPVDQAYNQAARLIEMGADVDELVNNCGIARPEAELMALLHKELHPPPRQQRLGK